MEVLRKIHFLVNLADGLYTLHTASSCFSKHFSATKKYNITDYDDVPIRDDGEECGEDDFLISDMNHLKLLAVADGVGSWNEYNINPKFFVSEFMSVLGEKYKFLDYLTASQHDSLTNTILYEIVFNTMNVLIRKSVNTGNINFGSCTLAALSINLNTLHANSYLMGDAGFMIIRNGEIAYQTEDQVKGFNFPYQLGNYCLLLKIKKMINFFKGLVDTSDHPIYGISKIFKLMPEDIIIVGSDGLFDNLFDLRILSIVNTHFQHVDRNNKRGYTQVARNIAKVLAADAKKIGEAQQNVWTPFGLDFAMEFGMLFMGGKNDDTTIIVAIITDE